MATISSKPQTAARPRSQEPSRARSTPKPAPKPAEQQSKPRPDRVDLRSETPEPPSRSNTNQMVKGMQENYQEPKANAQTQRGPERVTEGVDPYTTNRSPEHVTEGTDAYTTSTLPQAETAPPSNSVSARGEAHLDAMETSTRSVQLPNGTASVSASRGAEGDAQARVDVGPHGVAADASVKGRAGTGLEMSIQAGQEGDEGRITAGMWEGAQVDVRTTAVVNPNEVNLRVGGNEDKNAKVQAGWEMSAHTEAPIALPNDGKLKVSTDLEASGVFSAEGHAQYRNTADELTVSAGFKQNDLAARTTAEYQNANGSTASVSLGIADPGAKEQGLEFSRKNNEGETTVGFNTTVPLGPASVVTGASVTVKDEDLANTVRTAASLNPVTAPLADVAAEYAQPALTALPGAVLNASQPTINQVQQTASDLATATNYVNDTASSAWNTAKGWMGE